MELQKFCFTIYTPKLDGCGLVVSKNGRERKKYAQWKQKLGKNLQNMMVNNESLWDTDLSFILFMSSMTEERLCTQKRLIICWEEEKAKRKIIDRKLFFISIFHWIFQNGINFCVLSCGMKTFRDFVSRLLNWRDRTFVRLNDGSLNDGKSVNFHHELKYLLTTLLWRCWCCLPSKLFHIISYLL